MSTCFPAAAAAAETGASMSCVVAAKTTSTFGLDAAACQSVTAAAPGCFAASDAALAGSTSQQIVIARAPLSAAARFCPMRPQPTMAARSEIVGVKPHCKWFRALHARRRPPSALQRIFHPGRRRVDQAAQLRLRLIHLAFHLPRDFAVAEVALHAAAQLGDVFGLGEIHFEKKP